MQMLDSLKLIDHSKQKIPSKDSIIKIVESSQLQNEKFLLKWLKNFSSNREVFFTGYFNYLAGTDKLKKQIIDGESVENILNSWKPDIENFKKIRAKYLLYPDFKEKAKIYFIR